MIDNPTVVRFTASADHATLTRYELRSVVVGGAASGPVDLGLPTPVDGVITVPLETAGWPTGVEHRTEVRSVRGVLTSAWAASMQTGRRVVVPTYGPRVISKPSGVVEIAPGASIPAAVAANPAITTFWLQAGIHPITSAITPKTGNTFLGEFGAILDGTGWATTDFTQAAIRAHNQNIDTVTVANLVIRNMPQKGIHAFHNFSQDWTIEHCEVSGCHTGISVPPGAIVRRNYIHHNIGNPTAPSPGDRGGGYIGNRSNNALFEQNRIANNGPEQKIVVADGVIFRNNYVHDNYFGGIWLDGANTNALIEDNLVEDHPEEGIFYEVSGSGIIRNNTVRRSTVGHGIFVSTSKDVQVYGNVVEDCWRGIQIYIHCARIGEDPSGGAGFSADLRNVTVRDNTIRVPTTAGSYATLLGSTACAGAPLVPYTNGSKNLTFINNTYLVPSLTTKYWNWSGPNLSWAEWQATLGHDATGSRSLI